MFAQWLALLKVHKNKRVKILENIKRYGWSKVCSDALQNLEERWQKMLRHAREEGGGKQKKCMDEREESFITVPQFLNKNRGKSLHILPSFQSTEKEGRRGKKNRQNK